VCVAQSILGSAMHSTTMLSTCTPACTCSSRAGQQATCAQVAMHHKGTTAPFNLKVDWLSCATTVGPQLSQLLAHIPWPMLQQQVHQAHASGPNT
jgi:hypothetical protein